MPLIFLLLILPLFGAVDADNFFDLFAIQSKMKKCCAAGEVVLNQGGRFQCVKNFRQYSHFVTLHSWANFGNECVRGETCVDHVIFRDGFEHLSKLTCLESSSAQNFPLTINNYVVIELNPQVLPKCCPPKHEYSPEGHSCNRTQQEQPLIQNYLLNNNNFYIKLPLVDCTIAIEDFLINEDDFATGFNDKDYSFRVANATMFPFGRYCIDKVFTSNKEYVIRGCLESTARCRTEDRGGKRCIRKCCPPGHAYIGGSTCSSGFFPLRFNQTESVLDPDEEFIQVQGTTCRKYPVSSAYGNFSLDELGQLNAEIEDKLEIYTPFEQSYCYEHVQFDEMDGTILFLCFRVKDHERPQVTTAKYTVSLSCIFLIFTLIGYVVLKKHTNLHGKILMSHCATLLVAFCVLAYLQLSPHVNGEKLCKFLGYTLVFAFMGAFSWLNIMCFDIWWTCGSMRIQEMQDKAKELRKFLRYCLYAILVPTLVTAVTFVVQQYGSDLPKSFQKFVPSLGVYNCFYEQKHNLEAYVLFFLLPAGIIFACNLFLFVRTVMYCYKVKNEIERMKDTNGKKREKKRMFNANREKLNMTFKLFLVMGIPWFIEVISAIVFPTESKGTLAVIEILFDLVNSLQGVFIFCIFILKVKFLQEIKSKFSFGTFRRTSQATSSFAVSNT